MALRVLDGNQTATTLSSVVTGGEHIVAHSVVSLGANAIANITSAVSGSVVSVSNFPSSQATTFGAITGSVSVLNFPSSQAVTFTQAPVTFGAVTASVSVLNFPSSQSVTFTAITGSASILNFPSTQAVTFGQASTTFGAVTGSVSILNFPASQSVTFGQTTVTGQVELGPTSLNALESITVTMGQVTVTGGLTNTELRASAVTVGGTVTANVVGLNPQGNIKSIPVAEAGDSQAEIGIPIVANIGGGPQVIGDNYPLPISGTVTVGSPLNIEGNAVAVALYTTDVNGNTIFSGEGGPNPDYGIKPIYHADISDTNAASEVKESSGLPIRGSIGALTTRFGSVATANTAFATSAVTNNSRKYLLIQNVTTGSNVITVGIGFTPTTTQGIQLTAGAGITFESSYIPTGAVYVLSSVTASNFTILEA